MRLTLASVKIPSARFVVLAWRLAEPEPSYADARIQIFRSQDASPGIQIADLPGMASSFVDEHVPTTWRLWSRLTYTIVATTPTARAEAVVRPEPPQHGSGLALADQLRILLRTQYGTPGLHLPALDFGQRCPDCYDPVRGRTSRSHCRTCWDTTFVGGYGQPESIHFKIEASEEILEQVGFAELEPSQTTCWLANHPDLAPRDLLVEAEQRRWRVVSVKNLERQRTRFRQVALLDEIERDAVEYGIEIPG